MHEFVTQRINESIELKKSILDCEDILLMTEKVAMIISDAIRNGNKVVLCGNGGSASDALHFAGEIVGRFVKERKAWPAVVLNADVATMTAISNDYGYDNVFARQAQGICQKGDVFIGISTSGNSVNVLRAVGVATEKGAITVALLGNDGGEIAKIADYPVIVGSNITARVQETHIMLIHIICEMVELELCNE